MSIEMSGSGTQYIDFGTGSSAIGLTSFSASMWIQTDDIAAGGTYILLFDGTGTDTDQYWTIGHVNTQEQKIGFVAHYSTTDGVWRTTSNQISSAATWYHVVVTYNGSSSANNPAIYINGTSVAVTRSTSPVGTFRTGTNSNIYLGDTFSGFNYDGKLSDVRVYNTVLTASQVNALYSAGAQATNFDTNLVFHAPLTTATALSGSSFDGFTMTSSQKLIDRIGCAQGTCTGSPLGSTSEPS